MSGRTGDKGALSSSDEYSDDSLSEDRDGMSRRLKVIPDRREQASRRLAESPEKRERVSRRLAESPEKRERVSRRLAELASQWEDEHSACQTIISSAFPAPQSSFDDEETRLLGELKFLQNQLQSLTQSIKEESLAEGI